ncbi:hypothetical protein GEMRC1_003370 [Eukaryota sp. GEM-RC1]
MLSTASVFGLDAHRYNNIHFLDPEQNLILYAAGNAWHIKSLTSSLHRTFPGTNSGIGCITTSHNHEYIAIGESGPHPCISIYNYPSLELTKTLRNGTTNYFTSLAFSHSDKYLASVGGEPDYMLTVWDWVEEKIILRAKAFSQEVYSVQFSPTSDSQLVTSGTVHIKFWTMATTFTGLKLDGKLGRFGAVELSDIVSFVQFQDGKVLSGSEAGELLLWEGSYVKAIFRRSEESACHDDLETNEPVVIVSCGHDGRIATWDFELIDSAFPEGDQVVYIEPVSELYAKDCHFHSIIERIPGKEYYVTDSAGSVVCFYLNSDYELFDTDTIMTFFGGQIKSLTTVSSSYLIGLSSDCRICLFDSSDVSQPKLIDHRTFHSGATCLLDLSTPILTLFLIAGATGILRLISVSSNIRSSSPSSPLSLTLVSAVRPHATTITSTCSSLSNLTGSMDDVVIASVSTDGLLWFSNIFLSSPALNCLYYADIKEFIEVKLEASPSLCWYDNGVLIALGLSQLMYVPYIESLANSGEYDVTNQIKSFVQFFPLTFDTSFHFEPPVQRELINKKRSLIANRKDEIESLKERLSEEEIDKLPALTFEDPHVTKIDTFSVSSMVDYNNSIWVTGHGDLIGCLARYDLPLTPEATPSLVLFAKKHAVITQESIKVLDDHVMATSADGFVHCWKLSSPFDDLCPIGRNYVSRSSYASHDRSVIDQSMSSSLTISANSKMAVSGGHDGTLVFYTTSFGLEAEGSSIVPGSVAMGGNDLEEDCLTIEEASEAEGQKKRDWIANQKKSAMRTKINQLRIEFNRLLKRDQSKPLDSRLNRSEFYIDDTLLQSIRNDTLEIERKTRSSFDDKVRRSLAMIKFISKYFHKELSNLELTVYSTNSESSISTIDVNFCVYDINNLRFFEESVMSTVDFDCDASSPQSEEQSPQSKPQELTYDETSLSDRSSHSSPATTHKRLPTSLHSSPMVSSFTGDHSTLERLQARKQRKASRKVMWEKFYAKRPDFPDDISNDAGYFKKKKSIGTYILKEHPDFVVPVSQRIDARSKQIEIGIGVHTLLVIIKKFNFKIFGLRDEKMELIKACRERKEAISSLIQKLYDLRHLDFEISQFDLQIPTMFNSERPELLFLIDDHLINLYKAQLEKEASKSNQGGGFSGIQKTSEEDEEEVNILEYCSKIENEDVLLPSPPTISSQVDQERSQIHPSELSVYRSFLMDNKKKKILDQLHMIMSIDQSERAAFDQKLQNLKFDRVEKLYVLAQIQLSLLVLSQEYSLVKNFEQSEHHLMGQVQKKLDEKSVIEGGLEKFKQDADEKKRSYDKISQKLKGIFTSFDELVPEGETYRDALLKILKRRVKMNQDESDDDFDNFDDDDLDLDFDFNSDPDACPTGCSASTHQKVLDLRTLRLEIQEELDQSKATMDQVNVFLSQQQSKEKVIATGLKSLYKEIDDLQSSKQSKINQLRTSFVLPSSSISPALDPTDLPAEPQNVVLGERDLPEKLVKHREVHELEASQLKGSLKTLSKNRKQLVADYVASEKELSYTKDKLESIQLLQYGRCVDLDDLEKHGAQSMEVSEIASKIVEQEEDYGSKLAAEDDEVTCVETLLMKLMRENTARLKKLSQLVAEHRSLLNVLNDQDTKVTSKAPVSEVKGGRNDLDNEKRKLVREIKNVDSEIQTLTSEIELLRRKDTFVYNPIT